MARPKPPKPLETIEPEASPGDMLPDTPDAEAFSELGDIAQLAGPEFQSWTWWVYRLKDADERERNPGGKPKVLVTKVTGPLDVIEIQQRYGGGVFEFWGFFDGGLKMRPRVELDGPRRAWPSPPQPQPEPAPAPTAAPTAAVSALDARLDRLERAVTQALERPAAGPGMSMADFLKLLPLLQQQQPSSTDAVREIMGAFRMGAEMRESVSPKETTTAELVIDRLLPSVERLAMAFVSRSRAPGPPVPHPLRPGPSARAPEAEVISDPPPANPPGWTPPPGEVEADMAATRRMALVDSLARAIRDGVEPADFVVTIDNLLEPDEVEQLAGLTSEMLMPQLVELSERYPVFQSPGCRPFVDAVLTELRNPQA